MLILLMVQLLIHGAKSIVTPSSIPLYDILYITSYPMNLLFICSLTKSLQCSKIIFTTHSIFQDFQVKMTI